MALIAALMQSASAQDRPKPLILANVAYPDRDSTAFSSDGRVFMTGNFLGTVRLWDTTSGRLIRSFVPRRPDDRQYVSGIGFSAKANLVVSNDRYGVISIWRASTGQLLRTIGKSTDDLTVQHAFVFTPDGRQMFSANGCCWIQIRDTGTWSLRRTIQTGVNGQLAFSPDTRYALAYGIVEAGTDKPGALAAKLLELPSGRVLWSLEGASASIAAAAFSPDGITITTGGKRVSCDPAKSDGTAKRPVLILDTNTGKQLHVFDVHVADVSSISFSQDGTRVISVGLDGLIKTWEVHTGRQLQDAAIPIRRKSGDDCMLAASPKLLLAPGSTRLASFLWDEDTTWRLWDPQTGRMIGTLGIELGATRTISSVPGTHFLRSGNFVGRSGALNSWNLQTGRLLSSVAVSGAVSSGYSQPVAFSPDGSLAAMGSGDEDADREKPPQANPLTVWDVASGTVVRTLPGHPKRTTVIAFSPDGKSILSAGGDGSATLWNAADGQIRWTMEFPTAGGEPYYECAAFSRKGDRLLLGSNDGVRLFDVQTGNLIRFFAQWGGYGTSSVAFSPDGRRMVASNGDWENNAAIWDLATGALLRTLKGHSRVVFSVAFSPDGSKVLTGGLDGTARIWNAATGRQVSVLRLDSASPVLSVEFSPDGARALTGHADGSIAIWNAATGERIATLIAGPDGEWLVITAEGFFDASPKGSQLIHVVSGMDVVTIGQVFQQLYRPDLVREKLAGDPQGKVRAAAAALDLNKVLASGAVPQIRILNPADGSQAEQDHVGVEVEVSDRGGGIGRVEWRVNGVTLGVEEPARSSPGGLFRLQRTLQLDEGDNVVEVIVYNARDLIASESARTIIRWNGTGSRTPPRLYVLAVGINEYSDGRLRLSFAAPDAKAFASALQLAARDLFPTIQVVTALDADVTRDRLNAIMATLANEVKPTDVFVFFIAGHGRTIDGRYYFLPEDFRYRDDASIRDSAISQDQLQTWFAKIAAQKSVLIFDTCGSGSLTQELFATRSSEYLVAVDRLTHAIGRTVLSASSAYQQAIEGYHNHGLFTYTLLEGLGRASANDDGLITILSLHDSVMLRVPQLSAQVFGRRQEPMAGFRGTSFPLVKPTNVLVDDETAAALTISSVPTHVTIRAVPVYRTPSIDDSPVRTLQPGTLITVVLAEQEWVLIAKDGKQLGYVAANSVARLQ